MLLINSLKEEVAHVKKENIIETEIENLLLKKIKLLRQHFCKLKIQITNLIYHWQIMKR